MGYKMDRENGNAPSRLKWVADSRDAYEVIESDFLFTHQKNHPHNSANDGSRQNSHLGRAQEFTTQR